MAAMNEAAKQDWIDGARVMLPLLPGALPFGMIAGVVASDAGLDALAGIGQSIVVFAGAAQLASAQLIADAAPVLVVILTGLVINLRFAMYSAAMASHFSALPRWRRWLVSYLMTDQSYALSVLRFTARTDMSLAAKFAFYMGGAIPMWAVWLAATATGYILGNRIPANWSLDFFVPLSFLALIVPSIADRANAAAALTGGAVAVVAWPLPFNLGLFLAAISGIAAGYAVERLLPQQGENR